MLRRSFAFAALAAALTACTSSTAPDTITPAATVTAGAFQLVKVNGANASPIDPYRYTYQNPGDALPTFVQITGGVACVSAAGRFSFLRVLGSAYMVNANTFLPIPGAAAGYVEAVGTAAAIGDGLNRWAGTIVQNEQPLELIARHAGDSLTVSIPREHAAYLLIEAGPGSPMRENCRRAGY